MGRPTEPTSAVPGKSQLFIVRIWEESEHAETHRWRGSAEHVPSRQRFYFSSLADLNDFISLRLNLPAATAGMNEHQ
jgi:hypothetical protein